MSNETEPVVEPPVRPTIEEQKVFGEQFKDSWSRLCENKEFLIAVTDDLIAAERLALEILSKSDKKIIDTQGGDDDFSNEEPAYA